MNQNKSQCTNWHLCWVGLLLHPTLKCFLSYVTPGNDDDDTLKKFIHNQCIQIQLAQIQVTPSSLLLLPFLILLTFVAATFVIVMAFQLHSIFESFTTAFAAIR